MTHLAIPYRRFSSDMQIGNTSLTRQQGLVSKWLTANPEYVTLPQFEYVDEAVSGFHGDNISTGQLGKFIGEVSAGTFKRYDSPVLLLENFDRFGRLRPRAAMGYITQILDAGISICLLDKNELIPPEKADDDFFLMQLVMTASRAHGESKRKSENVSSAWSIKAGKIEGGHMLTRNVPWWINPDDRQLVIPERAKLVERIFKMRLAGESCYAIGKKLNSEHIPVYSNRMSNPDKEKDYKKKRVAECWHSARVSALLSNKAVIGVLAAQQINKHNKHRINELRGDTPGYFPEVVSPTLFYAIQSLKDEKQGRKRTATNINSIQIFKKMIRCTCGNYMDVTGCRERYAGVFKCASVRAGSTQCHQPSINRQSVEDALLTRLIPSLNRISVNHELTNQVMTLEAAIAELSERIDKGWSDYENPEHPFYQSTELASRINASVKKKAEEVLKLSQLKVTEKSSQHESVTHLDLSDYTQRCEARVILKRMIGSITLDAVNKTLDVHLVNGNSVTGFCIESDRDKTSLMLDANDDEKHAELTASIGEHLPLVIRADDPSETEHTVPGKPQFNPDAWPDVDLEE